VIDPRRPFDFEEGARTIHYGRGRAAEAVELVGGPGYALLTTARASALAPHIAESADAVHLVPSGLVDEIAAGMLEIVRSEPGNPERLVALGGGRVIDVAKALSAAAGAAFTERRPGWTAVWMPPVAAIPTTLSAAEMTRVHRHARGIPPNTRGVRPRTVLTDPELAASQPPAELAASTLNALGHAVEGPLTPDANPIATLAAREAARLLVSAWEGDEPDRDALALGALLSGYAIDSQGYGLHHALAQTMVRVGGTGHGPANAVLLPHTIPALARRFPAEHEALSQVLGEDPATAAARICALTGATTLRDLGVERDALERCAETAAKRRDTLAATPPPADRDEILAIYEAAW
jgi:alcohol dehydrogenase class IV